MGFVSLAMDTPNSPLTKGLHKTLGILHLLFENKHADYFKKKSACQKVLQLLTALWLVPVQPFCPKIELNYQKCLEYFSH